jgi:hypothetical protein
MKGIIFNLFEKFVIKGWGEDVYEKILETSALSKPGPFLGPATYPDADLMALVGSASKLLQVPPEVAVRKFGHFCFRGLTSRFPRFLEGIPDAKSFLLTVDKIIHVEVHKLYHDAETPTFRYHDTGAASLTIEYRSRRRLCVLMEGLIEGLADHFHEDIRQSQSKCLHRGDSYCEFHLEFSRRMRENSHA